MRKNKCLSLLKPRSPPPRTDAFVLEKLLPAERLALKALLLSSKRGDPLLSGRSFSP